jgi:prepilin-type N-terminal cleavage/methylation domain-containing protein
MKNKNNKKHRNGFSLVELLVAVFIIAAISAISFFALRGTRGATQLRASQREVAAVIRLAQSYAIQGKTQLIGGEQKVPCGYGFRFISNNEYQIFYNEPPTGAGESCQIMNNPCAPDDCKYNSSSKSLEGFSLKGNVVLDSPGYLTSSLYFSVPNSIAYDNNGSLISSVSYILKYDDLGKIININSTGL